MRILLIEDDRKIAGFLKSGLNEQGFKVTHCEHGDEGYDLARHSDWDAILLDIMLPGRDGLSILRNLRDQKRKVPVILLTARAEVNERIEGLNLGADDYLPKPFYLDELVARLHAVIRRASGTGQNRIHIDGLEIDLLARTLTRGEESIELTGREFTLLELLVRSPGRVFTRTQILEKVWGYDFDPQTNVVEVYIRRVRRKIDPEGQTNRIETVRGVGYRFKA